MGIVKRKILNNLIAISLSSEDVFKYNETIVLEKICNITIKTIPNNKNVVKTCVTNFGVS